jgi:DNA-directed RNA polymerase specialized sigma24 family protein
MAATDPVSEADLESAFRDDPDFAIELLDSDYREGILRYIKCETHGLLRPDELMVAYQETMLALIQRIPKPAFDPERPLRLVCAIARNKGLDILREHGHKVKNDEDAILGAVAADLKNTDLGFEWRRNIGPTEAKEFREVLLEIILTLPHRQRIVAQCFVDHFEDFSQRNTYRPLAEAVSAITGKPESVAAVKSDWRFAREKIAAALIKRGYSFIPGE